MLYKINDSMRKWQQSDGWCTCHLKRIMRENNLTP